MKTKEFIEKVKESGFVATTDKYGAIRISRQDGTWLSSVDIEKQFDVSFFEHKHITPKIFSLITEYAKTPLEEREEEKKCYVKVNNPILKEGLDETESYFINYRAPDDYFLSDEFEDDEYKTQFTQKEIYNFPDEVKEILPLCKQIEVTP